MPFKSQYQNDRSKLQVKKVNFIKSFGIFCIFMVANVLAALYAPIHDCDETFNYWEPTHFISHGYGLQTWEYSPEYSIRSWLYIIIHATIGSVRRILPSTSKVAEFYFIRYILAFCCAFCQTIMFQAIKNMLNPRIALYFMVSMIFSPGMYHASVSFLPSSFSMFTTMFGITAFMDKRQEIKIPRGITWFSIGGIIGWPFSLVLSVPFLLHEVTWAARNGGDAFSQTLWRFKRGIFASVLILLFEILVSGIFYRRFVIVPLNIVLYNVISGPGPNIYGTEPWHFYFRNLLLNFNIWFVLAIISLPLHKFPRLCPYDKQPISRDVRSTTLLTPFYLWLLIFSLQSHKEERFMYPLYPFLALNAAMSLHLLLVAFGNIKPRSNIIGKIPGSMKFLIVVSVFITFIGVGLARIYGVYTAYSAPLYIYEPLSIEGSRDDFVCFGKDWYRFPSSYHLPRNIHAKFIKSEFRGLIPGEFSEATRKSDFRSGTWLMPSNMNDRNLEDLGKYIEISACDFLVDTYYPARKPSSIEPNYIDSSNWKTIRCLPFLDASQTSFLGRVFWLPETLLFVPENWQQTWKKRFIRKWGRHCLLKHEKPRKIKR